MKILYQDWRIKTHDPYGFVVQRFKPKSNQWKESAYFRTLEQAARYLFDEQIRTQFEDFEFDLNDVDRAAKDLNRLVQSIKIIGNKIAGACNG